MIRSFRGGATRRFATEGKSKFSGMDVQTAFQRLAEIDAAFRISDLDGAQGGRLHKLKGNLSDFWSMKINGPWRVIFRFTDGDAHDVEIIDYH